LVDDLLLLLVVLFFYLKANSLFFLLGLVVLSNIFWFVWLVGFVDYWFL